MADSAEGLDNETLMQLLKEKAKELKQSQKKLKKVEDKFVEMHKSQKNLMNDRETFIQFLHLVFPQSLLEEEIMLMPEGSEGFGMFDFNHLRQFWTLTKQNQENEHLAMLETMQDQKKIMAQKILEYEEQQNTSSNQKSQAASPGDSSDVEKLRQENVSLKEQIKSFKSSQSSSEQLIKSEQKYLAEIKDLEQKIRSLQAENSEIKAKELISTIQSQGLQGSTSAMPQIDMQKQVNELKQQMSNKTNQILQLQEDKEELESKLQMELQKGELQTVVSEQVTPQKKEEVDEDGINQQLEGFKTDLKEKDELLEKKEKYNKELEQKLQKLLMDFAQMRTKAQEMLVKKDMEIKKFKQKLGQESPQKKGDVHQMDMNSNNSGIESDYSDSDSDEQIKEAKAHRNKNTQFEQIDQTSRAYIKNILLKYLEYQAEGLQKETKMMEKVLFTVLKVHEKDINELQEARLSSYNSGIMSYIWAAEGSDLVAHPVKPRAFNPGEKKFGKNKN